MTTIRYLVASLDDAMDFYIRHLGFVLEERWGTALAILSREELRLWLSGPQTSAARPMPDGRVPQPGGWNRIVIPVEDLQSSAAGLRAAGVVFRNEIIRGPGGAQVLIEDPSGNPVELFEEA